MNKWTEFLKDVGNLLIDYFLFLDFRMLMQLDFGIHKQPNFNEFFQFEIARIIIHKQAHNFSTCFLLSEGMQQTFKNIWNIIFE